MIQLRNQVNTLDNIKNRLKQVINFFQLGINQGIVVKSNLIKENICNFIPMKKCNLILINITKILLKKKRKKKIVKRINKIQLVIRKQ